MVVSARDELTVGLDPAPESVPVEWRISRELVPYEAAVAAMEARANAIAAGSASELVWLLAHPPLYTAGTSANANDLIEARFPVHETGPEEPVPVLLGALGDPEHEVDGADVGGHAHGCKTRTCSNFVPSKGDA